MSVDPRDASDAVVDQHRSLLSSLPFVDARDFDDVTRGLVARRQPNAVTADDGRVVWDNDTYDFLEGDAPDTVNPSLWRQSTLVATDGLFEVVPGIYQVRGMDLSNITLRRGRRRASSSSTR